MGLTTVTAKVGGGKRAREIDFLVDSGASFTVLPEKVRRALRLKPIAEQKFALADGAVIRRRISEVRLEYAGEARTVQVVLGERGDQSLPRNSRASDRDP